MGLTFPRVAESEASAVAEFLMGSDWPFHGAATLSRADAQAISFSNDETRSFWINETGTVVGLVRLLDLGDLDDGSPLFDLRIASEYRGRGFGTAAVRWLSEHLFLEFPELHRIEATTRSDNAGMIATFHRCGYRQEGRFLEAWKSRDGSRHDTLAYALLRREWATNT